MHRELDLASISALIQQSPEFELYGAEADPDRIIKACRSMAPEAVLLHAAYPKGNAFKLAEVLLLSNTVKAVAFLDDSFVLVRAEFAIELEHCCYLTRNSGIRQIYQTILGVLQLRSGAANQSRTRRDLYEERSKLAFYDPFGVMTLSAREREVMAHLAAGHTVAQTAAAVGLAHSTIDNHKVRIMKKLDIHRTTDLARIALSAGFIEFDEADSGNAQRRLSQGPPRPHMVLGLQRLGPSQWCVQ